MKNTSIFLVIIISLFWSCQQDTQWKGQEPLKKVDTHTAPIQKQIKGTFDIGGDIYCSNDFDGARLNGVVLTNDTLITVLITPENTPIRKPGVFDKFSPFFAHFCISKHACPALVWKFLSILLNAQWVRE